LRSSSIRARLLLGVTAVQLMVVATAIYLVVAHERSQSYITFDANLGEKAAVLHSLVEAPEEDADTFLFHKEFMTVHPDALYYIVDSKGRKIAGSPGWGGPQALPSSSRSIIEITLGRVRFRGIALQRFPLVEREFRGASSPTLTLLYAAPIAPVEAHIHSVEMQSIGAGLALLIVLTIVSGWAVTQGLSPLRQLASSAASIDVGRWTLAEVESSRRVSELAPVATALISLVGRLREAFERERQFFGDAAHEMKSSIAIVRSTLQLALQAKRTALEYRRGLEEALEDTGRLQDLVTSMLDLARIERSPSNEVYAEESTTEANSQAHRVIRRFNPLAEQKGVRIALETAPEEAWVRMSDNDLLTVLSNLVENAIHYSSAGQQITIRVRSGAGICTVSVIDEGCGISEAALPHVFDRFYRSDDSRSRATGGTGLGLSITRALVRRADGSISVVSDYGHGSVFSIVLPRT